MRHKQRIEKAASIIRTTLADLVEEHLEISDSKFIGMLEDLGSIGDKLTDVLVKLDRHPITGTRDSTGVRKADLPVYLEYDFQCAICKEEPSSHTELCCVYFSKHKTDRLLLCRKHKKIVQDKFPIEHRGKSDVLGLLDRK